MENAITKTDHKEMGTFFIIFNLYNHPIHSILANSKKA